MISRRVPTFGFVAVAMVLTSWSLCVYSAVVGLERGVDGDDFVLKGHTAWRCLVLGLALAWLAFMAGIAAVRRTEKWKLMGFGGVALSLPGCILALLIVYAAYSE